MPSCQRASGRSVNATHERSAGTSIDSASKPYWLNASSAESTVSES